jgi:hypothetical protein
MGKHAAPIVVRLWPDGYGEDSINALVHDWDAGGFTLRIGHPFAQRVFADISKTDLTITVLDSDVVEWRADSISVVGLPFDPRCLVRCTPRVDVVRRSLRADAVLIEYGLVS